MKRDHWVLFGQTLLGLAIMVGGFALGYGFKKKQRAPQPPVVTISFLNITDGDATVVRTPDGHTALIDAGGSQVGTQVVDALRRLGVHQIDLLVLASPCDSSIGGVPAILASKLPIRSVWNNSVTTAPDPKERDQVMADLARAGIPLRVAHMNEQTRLGTGQIPFTAIWPPQHGERSKLDALICRIDFGSQSCLFLGPLASESEPYLISGASDKIQADVLQVTNHGDGQATEPELLRRVQPSIAVISATQTAAPAPATVQRLQAAEADVWQTDQQGTVTVTLATTPGTPGVTGSTL